MNNRGFSLLELVVVLGIIAIISAAAMLNFRSSAMRDLNNVSLTLQADLRYAQRLAMIEGREIAVSFDLQNNSYSIVSLAPQIRTLRTVQLDNNIAQLRRTSHPNTNQIHFRPRTTVSYGFEVVLSCANNRYWQRLTAAVSAGRIKVFEPSIGDVQTDKYS
ncbi:MAG: prepilin-type N-terminal cleavage/methylation domain-containing protein [Defluviitaleaceae bacterium]|nr:prepilin-type N-terminal cleavage/methylation domain-containing protein [Defluviitaleaceae bacterium]